MSTTSYETVLRTVVIVPRPPSAGGVTCKQYSLLYSTWEHSCGITYFFRATVRYRFFQKQAYFGLVRSSCPESTTDVTNNVVYDIKSTRSQVRILLWVPHVKQCDVLWVPHAMCLGISQIGFLCVFTYNLQNYSTNSLEYATFFLCHKQQKIITTKQ